MLVDKTIKVEKSGDDVMQAIVGLVKAVKAQHVAGQPLVVEITSDVTAAVQNLGPILGEVGQVPADALESRVGMLKAVTNGAIDLTEAVLS